MDTENKNSPFFSVVIPVYNGEGYIGQCIGSILSQRFENFEVLVINDGSTDKTLEVLSEICKTDGRVRVLNLENGGVFRARAYGARECRGTYLIYSDDDDLFPDPHAFEKLYERARDEKYDVIQYGYYKKFNHLRFRENSVKRETTADSKEFYERDFPYLLSSRNIDSRLMLNTVTKVYHKRLYKNGPDPEGLERLFMGDDLVMNLYFLEGCQSALYLPDTYYLSYRLRGSSGSYRRGEMHNLDIIKKYQMEFLNRWNGKSKKEYERLHHFETAEWLLDHTVRSYRETGEDETKKLLSEVLGLPAFVRAREYFENGPEDNLPVRLLLSNDVCGYIRAAQKDRGGSAKAKVYKFLKEKVIFRL